MSEVVITNTETTYVVENVGVVGPSGIQAVAPESPVNGDIWIQDNALKIKLGGVVYNITMTPA